MCLSGRLFLWAFTQREAHVVYRASTPCLFRSLGRIAGPAGSADRSTGIIFARFMGAGWRWGGVGMGHRTLLSQALIRAGKSCEKCHTCAELPHLCFEHRHTQTLLMPFLKGQNVKSGLLCLGLCMLIVGFCVCSATGLELPGRQEAGSLAVLTPGLLSQAGVRL